MSSTRNAAENLAHDAADELARLRSQVEELMKDRVSPALHSVALQAENAAKQASDEVRAQAASLSEAVQEKPLLALGIAALAGFVLASLIRR